MHEEDESDVVALFVKKIIIGIVAVTSKILRANMY